MSDSVDTPTSEARPSTPTRNLHSIPSSELSPPDSRGGPRLPQPPLRGSATAVANSQAPTATAPGMSPTEVLNANGKRTYDATAASSAGTCVANGATAASSAAPAKGQGKFSHPGGYSWDREEDAPGYGWQNKKAQEDMYRAMSQIVDLDMQIKNRYGDVLLDNPVTATR